MDKCSRYEFTLPLLSPSNNPHTDTVLNNYVMVHSTVGYSYFAEPGHRCIFYTVPAAQLRLKMTQLNLVTLLGKATRRGGSNASKDNEQ